MKKICISLVFVCLLFLVLGGGLHWMVEIWRSNYDFATTSDDHAVVLSNDDNNLLRQTVSKAGDDSQAGASHLPARKIQIEHAMRWDTDGLQAEVRPDGVKELYLDGRFTHISAAVRMPSGEMKIQCFSGHAALDNAITSGVTNPNNTSHSEIPVNY